MLISSKKIHCPVAENNRSHGKRYSELTSYTTIQPDYQNPRTFHQTGPMPTQIIRLTTEMMNPSRHQVA